MITIGVIVPDVAEMALFGDSINRYRTLTTEHDRTISEYEGEIPAGI
jgi:hypothetical protein